ncbi:hypothetical protein EMIT0324P_170055 [Pseudomonas chlororaphis]
MDLIIPSLPKMLQWPAWRGLVIMEEERIQRYDADGSEPVEKDNIDPNDILVTRCADQYMSGRYPGMDLFLPKNGDGFFRAVLAGVYGKELDDRAEAKLVQGLRGQVADYVRENWDDFKDFVIQDGVSLAGDAKLEPLSTAALSQPPATPGGAPAMEMLHQASRLGKASFIPMLMAQVEALVVPALEAIRAGRPSLEKICTVWLWCCVWSIAP